MLNWLSSTIEHLLGTCQVSCLIPSNPSSKFSSGRWCEKKTPLPWRAPSNQNKTYWIRRLQESDLMSGSFGGSHVVWVVSWVKAEITAVPSALSTWSSSSHFGNTISRLCKTCLWLHFLCVCYATTRQWPRGCKCSLSNPGLLCRICQGEPLCPGVVCHDPSFPLPGYHGAPAHGSGPGLRVCLSRPSSRLRHPSRGHGELLSSSPSPPRSSRSWLQWVCHHKGKKNTPKHPTQIKVILLLTINTVKSSLTFENIMLSRMIWGDLFLMCTCTQVHTHTSGEM